MAYANERESFGKVLMDHQGVSFQLADNLMDMDSDNFALGY